MWNGTAIRPNFDIRDWDPRHEHMSRGITLRREEAAVLAGLLNKYLDEEDNKDN